MGFITVRPADVESALTSRGYSVNIAHEPHWIPDRPVPHAPVIDQGVHDLPHAPVIDQGVHDLPHVSVIDQGIHDLPHMPVIDQGVHDLLHMPVIHIPVEDVRESRYAKYLRLLPFVSFLFPEKDILDLGGV